MTSLEKIHSQHAERMVDAVIWSDLINETFQLQRNLESTLPYSYAIQTIENHEFQ